MPNNLSEQIRECLEHAEECARKAGAQTDPKIKADFLDLERRWLLLARSYEFSVALTATAKPDATQYLSFLRSQTAKSVFENYGFNFLVKPTS